MFLIKNPKAKIDARLLLIGSANYHQKLLNSYKNITELILKTSNCKFEEVYTMQQQASVNIILEAKAEVSPFLPGKFPHCVLANKPIFHLGPKKSETMRLLGNDYSFHAEIDNINEIAELIEQMYLKWQNNKDSFLLNRKDLEFYISKNQLEQILENVLINNE